MKNSGWTSMRAAAFAVTLGAAITGSPGPARAAEGEAAAAAQAAPALPAVPFTVGADLVSFYGRSDPMKLFSASAARATAGVSASYDLFHPGARTTVAVGAGWFGDHTDNSWGNTNRAALDVDTFYASAVARYGVLPWLEPMVRLTAGGAWGRANLGLGQGNQPFFEDDGGGSTNWSLTSDRRAASFTASAGAGLRLRSNPFRPSNTKMPFFALSATIEGGYAVATAMSFTLTTPRPSDDKIADDRIPGTAIALGSVDRSRPYFRVGLGLHF
jgi:hypothetical protein